VLAFKMHSADRALRQVEKDYRQCDPEAKPSSDARNNSSNSNLRVLVDEKRSYGAGAKLVGLRFEGTKEEKKGW